MLLFLAACAPRTGQIAECEFETRKLFPNQTFGLSAPMQNLMTLCMKAEGFTWSTESKDCHLGFAEGNNPFASAACYEPTWYYEQRIALENFSRKWLQYGSGSGHAPR